MNNVGRVISVNKNNWIILLNNESVIATIRKKKNHNELPVVGDYVIINKDEYDNYTIEKIVNRKNTIKKLSVDRTTEKYKKGKEQILASNVDIVFIVTSLNNDFNIARLERLVLLGNKANSKIAFILTKSDLCSLKDRENYKKIIEDRFNYPVFIISSYNKEGIDDLKSVWKENETAVFIGSSGVGKSTLINTLLDNDEIKTNDIRHKDDKGKHTTTSRNLYVLKDSRIVIDEPGIRSVASNDMNSDLNVVFSKIIELSKECKYTTCTHENIKVCRILQAIENGELSKERFEQYMKLQKESQYNTDSEQYLKSKKEKFKEISKMNKHNKKR